MNPPAANGITMNWRIETIDETDSTNDIVSARAREGEASGLVIQALSQTKGKGRRGRSWFSPPGSGLYFSILFHPDENLINFPLLTLLMGVAAAEGLAESTGLHTGLKWPNDLRISGKKIGGILCEYISSENQPPAVVAGVGINLSMQRVDFPPELRESASSILISGGRVPHTEHLLHVLLGRIAFWYKEYETNGFGAVRDRWIRLCDNLGEPIRVTVADEKVVGKNKGIDESGRFLLEKSDGSSERIISGEVEFQ